MAATATTPVFVSIESTDVVRMHDTRAHAGATLNTHAAARSRKPCKNTHSSSGASTSARPASALVLINQSSERAIERAIE